VSSDFRGSKPAGYRAPSGCWWPVLQSPGMDALVWTTIGLLGAALLESFGSFFYLGTRIDALGAPLDAPMDAKGPRIDGQDAAIRAGGRDLPLLSRLKATVSMFREPSSWPKAAT
jgi:hypothetical protein